MRLRNFAARKRKRGASLVMVLVSMTILTIMGTLFTTIAMRSYQYSYSRMCRQQAYYTATSSIESLYAKIKTNGGLLNDIVTALDNAYTSLTKGPSEGSSEGSSIGGINIDVTTVRVKIGSTGGGEAAAEGVVGSDFFYTYLGECDLWARYNNAKRTEISLEAEATYNGYSETARAIIAKTNAAASELKKIFDNTFCLQSPISTIVAETTHGDIYVSQPIADTDSAVVQNLVENQTISADDIKAYNTVFAALSENGITSNDHSGVPGQYLRYTNGDIITSGDEGKYNKVLRYGVYGNAQASTSNASLVGHTKPLDMDNTPLKTSNDIEKPIVNELVNELWYNDWVELYMFSAAEGGTAVNGDLYSNSKILIGVLDRDTNGVTYLRSWDNTIKRSVFSYNDDKLDNYLNSPEYEYLTLNSEFEHGFKNDVFFNHKMDTLKVDRSVFRLNGDMYLWQDARIENFDSKNVPKSDDENDDGKNNIYAYKNLYIDGMYIKTGWTTGANMPTTSNVVVGGDIVVKGNAQIMNATIYGDVYCYGDELTIVNCDIYGNVYFTGSNFTADWMHLYKTDGQGGNLVINHDGSNTNVTNYSTRDDYDKKPDNMTEYAWNNNLFGTTHDVGGDNTVYSWGATITNSDIYGTLWSNVNTHILISKWDEGGDSIPNYYGDIYVSKYLFIDLIWTYLAKAGNDRIMQEAKDYLTDDDRTSGHRENWLAYYYDIPDEKYEVNDHYDVAATFNCFEYTKPSQVIYAERFQLRTNQSDAQSLKSTDVNYLGHLYVGEGGLYIDGNEDGHDGRGDGGGNGKEGAYNGLSTKFESLYTASAGNIWDVTVSNEIKNETVWYWDGIIRKSTSWYNYHGMNYNGSVSAGEHKGGYNTQLERYIQNESMYRKDGSTSTSSLNFSYMHYIMHSIMQVQDSYAEKFDDPIWKDKLIKIRTWTAPEHSNDPGASPSVNYVGGETGIVYSTDEDVVNVKGYLYYLSKINPAAGSVSGTKGAGDYTLTIKQSVCFSNWVDWSAFDRIVIDTSKGNVYIRFLEGVELGKKGAKNYDEGAEVVLTGGSMVFWYLYENDSYDFKKPTLQVNSYTRLGLVSAETGSGYGYDGLYIISNDDSLITMGSNAVLNGFVYTPHGQVFIAPAESSYAALNGCMAIESLIMLSDPDEWTKTFWDEVSELLPEGSAFGQWITGGSEAIVDAIIKQYENIVFNYVQPPLIVDSNFGYGNTVGEIDDFGKVVWEFLGYY